MRVPHSSEIQAMNVIQMQEKTDIKYWQVVDNETLIPRSLNHGLFYGPTDLDRSRETFFLLDGPSHRTVIAAVGAPDDDVQNGRQRRPPPRQICPLPISRSATATATNQHHVGILGRTGSNFGNVRISTPSIAVGIISGICLFYVASTLKNGPHAILPMADSSHPRPASGPASESTTARVRDHWWRSIMETRHMKRVQRTRILRARTRRWCDDLAMSVYFVRRLWNRSTGRIRGENEALASIRFIRLCVGEFSEPDVRRTKRRQDSARWLTTPSCAFIIRQL